MLLVSRNQFRIILFFIVFILAISSGSLYLLYFDAEQTVHQAVLKSLQDKLPLADYSFASLPSTCRNPNRTAIPMLDKNLFDDFYKNNNVLNARPRRLSFSDRQYHLVSREDTLRLYAGKLPKLTGIPRKLINLSRVGFDASKTQALVCVETEESGDLAYLQKDDLGWHVSKWVYIW